MTTFFVVREFLRSRLGGTGGGTFGLELCLCIVGDKTCSDEPWKIRLGLFTVE